MGTTLRPNKLRANGRRPLHRDRKKQDKVRSNVKMMFIVFFNVRAIVHWEFVPPGQTVNQEFYVEVLGRLRENVRRKRPELWRSGDWFLHHDNAPVHRALSVTRYLASLGWTVVPHSYLTIQLSQGFVMIYLLIHNILKSRSILALHKKVT